MWIFCVLPHRRAEEGDQNLGVGFASFGDTGGKSCDGQDILLLLGSAGDACRRCCLEEIVENTPRCEPNGVRCEVRMFLRRDCKPHWLIQNDGGYLRLVTELGLVSCLLLCRTAELAKERLNLHTLICCMLVN